MPNQTHSKTPQESAWNTSTWPILLQYRRNDLAENNFHGAIAIWSGQKLIASLGGEQVCYARSLMKLFYMKLFAQELKDNTSWEQKAISLASHNGTPHHAQVAQSLLSEKDQHLMKTPPSKPLVPSNPQEALLESPWIHNSSGNHAGVLKGCQIKGWDTSNYMSTEHSVYKNLLSKLQSLLKWNPTRVAKDGDGLPTVALTVNELAAFYSTLVNEKSQDWIWESMVRCPEMIGGVNRLDTSIIQACRGKVIAKEGADGLLGMAIEHPDYPQGLGIVIKMAHGWCPQPTWSIASALLKKLNFDLPTPEAPHGQTVHLSPKITELI